MSSAIGLFVSALLLAVSASAGGGRTIAVAYFDNNTGEEEYDPLSKGLADMLITDLSVIESLHIVEREKLNRILGEIDLGKSAFIDPGTAQRLGKGLAAQYILTGAYVVQGGEMRVDARLVRVETGKVTLGEKVVGRTSEFFAIEKDLVDRLVAALGIDLGFSERAELRRNPTESFEAFSSYSEGLDASDRGDHEEARRAFRKALSADPEYRAAKSALERLRAILDRYDERRNAKVDRLWRSLDPEAPDFGQKINDMLASLDSNERGELVKKVDLLFHLAENDLVPPPANGFSRVPLEALALVGRFMEDPDVRPLVPGVCEYVITRYPDDQMSKPLCKNFMKSLERDTDLAAMRNRWEWRRAHASHDWEIALFEASDRIHRLFELWARKAEER